MCAHGIDLDVACDAGREVGVRTAGEGARHQFDLHAHAKLERREMCDVMAAQSSRTRCADHGHDGGGQRHVREAHLDGERAHQLRQGHT